MYIYICTYILYKYFKSHERLGENSTLGNVQKLWMAQAGEYDWLHLVFCELNLLEDSEYGQRIFECCGYNYGASVAMCQQCANENRMVCPTKKEQGKMWGKKNPKLHRVQACDSCKKLTCSRARKCLNCGTKCLALGHQLTKSEENKRNFEQTGIEEGIYTWGAQGGLKTLGPGWKKRNRGESGAAVARGENAGSNSKDAKDETALAPKANLKRAAPDSDDIETQAIPWKLKDRCCACWCDGRTSRPSRVSLTVPVVQ